MSAKEGARSIEEIQSSECANKRGVQESHDDPNMWPLHAFTLKSYCSFSQFMVGLEKLIMKYYFKSTNHHEEACLKQVLLKLNRLEELYRICKEIGHDTKTCHWKSELDSHHV